MTQQPSEPRETILLSALKDWVSLCEVIGHVDEARPGSSSHDLRDATLQVLVGLIRDGLLVPGETGTRFTPWPVEIEEAVAIISSEWSVPVLEIDPGHGWWFDLTDLGEKVAKSLDEHRSGGSQGRELPDTSH